LVFNPAWGDKLDEWTSYSNRVSEYLNNRYWTEVSITDSYARYQDMVAWGIEFQKDKDGKPLRTSQPNVVLKEIPFDGKRGDPPYILRQHALKAGVKLVNRVMITELLKQNGRVVGAFGISPDSDNTYCIVAKTTILCVGACSYKPAGFPPLHQLTGDGEAMAYRAGAEILGKEFVDTHGCQKDVPLASWNLLMRMDHVPENLKSMDLDRLGKYKVDAAGNRLTPRPAEASQYPQTYLVENFAAHAGQAPIYGVVNADTKNEIIAGACLGMSIRKADGLWPADKECRSSVPGLFAAGDAHGSMQNGAVYAINGSSSMGSAVTGAIAGVAAAKEAAQMSKPVVNESEIARARQFSIMPRERKGGYSPEWVTQLLQNTMAPYYIYFIKKADRLQSALTQVEFMQQHLVPALIARDPHELRLANETRSMVLSAEMRLRSALFRTESRGNHYREDYPRRDDQSWMAWTKIKEEQGNMVLIKVPMPREWWPDESIAYEKRYPVRFPGE
jgi:succinate dehydrogenase/fumarate reductase flavoprotein subunit